MNISFSIDCTQVQFGTLTSAVNQTKFVKKHWVCASKQNAHDTWTNKLPYKEIFQNKNKAVVKQMQGQIAMAITIDVILQQMTKLKIYNKVIRKTKIINNFYQFIDIIFTDLFYKFRSQNVTAKHQHLYSFDFESIVGMFK